VGESHRHIRMEKKRVTKKSNLQLAVEEIERKLANFLFSLQNQIKKKMRVIMSTLVNFMLFMFSTYQTVRSSIPRSTLLRDRNQTPRPKAVFLVSARHPTDKKLPDDKFGVESPRLMRRHLTP
jgi:hypothetical protein